MGKKHKKPKANRAVADTAATSSYAASFTAPQSAAQAHSLRPSAFQPHTVDRDLSAMPKTRLSQPFGMNLHSKNNVNNRLRLVMGRIRQLFSGKGSKNQSAINHRFTNTQWSNNKMKSNKTLFSLASQFTNTGTASSFHDNKVKKPVLWALVVGIIGTASYFGYAIMSNSNDTVAPVVTHVAPASTTTATKTLENTKPVVSKVEGVKHAQRKHHLFADNNGTKKVVAKRSSHQISKNKAHKSGHKLAKHNKKSAHKKSKALTSKHGKKKSQKLANNR